MIDFFNAVLEFEFLQTAIIGGVLACIACGVIGTYIVTRRITYIAGAIAHCVLAGVGGAYYLQKVHGLVWCDPFWGAFVSAILAALIIAGISLKAKQREDSVIGALWATGMALGVLFINATPGSNQELVGRLFGNIMLVSSTDLSLLVFLNIAVLTIGLGFYKQFFAICFDEQFARSRGINVDAYYILLLVLTAITVVLLCSIVGIIMVIALLTLPVAISSMFMKKLWHIMLSSISLSVIFMITGFGISYNLEYPPGAASIVFAGLIYLIMSACKAFVGRKPKVDITLEPCQCSK